MMETCITLFTISSVVAASIIIQYNLQQAGGVSDISRELTKLCQSQGINNVTECASRILSNKSTCTTPEPQPVYSSLSDTELKLNDSNPLTPEVINKLQDKLSKFETETQRGLESLHSIKLEFDKLKKDQELLTAERNLIIEKLNVSEDDRNQMREKLDVLVDELNVLRAKQNFYDHESSRLDPRLVNLILFIFVIWHIVNTVGLWKVAVARNPGNPQTASTVMTDIWSRVSTHMYNVWLWIKENIKRVYQMALKKMQKLRKRRGAADTMAQVPVGRNQ